MFKNFLLVGTGGFIGAIIRYLFYFLPISTFPYATLAVNVLGSFIIGILFTFLINPSNQNPIFLFIATGILGAFTTFSTFSLDTWKLFLAKEYLTLSVNVFSNIILCMLAVFIGSVIGKTITSPF